MYTYVCEKDDLFIDVFLARMFWNTQQGTLVYSLSTGVRHRVSRSAAEFVSNRRGQYKQNYYTYTARRAQFTLETPFAVLCVYVYIFWPWLCTCFCLLAAEKASTGIVLTKWWIDPQQCTAVYYNYCALKGTRYYMKTHSVAASHFMPYIAIIITCRGRRRNPFSNNNWIWCSSSASLVQRERDGIARSRRRNDCCRLRRPFTKLDLYLLVFYCSNCVCVVIIDLISFSAP